MLSLILISSVLVGAREGEERSLASLGKWGRGEEGRERVG